MDWTTFSARIGGRMTGDRGVDFPPAPRSAPGAVHPLPHLGILRVEGADASDFLHNQLTCDVKRLAPDTAVRGGYCTAKGRMLVNFLLWRDEGGYWMVLSADLVPSIVKRLSMYVLRAKVTLRDASPDHALLGLSGAPSAGAVQAVLSAVPRHALGVARTSGGTAIELQPERYLLVVPSPSIERNWATLASMLSASGTESWRRDEIALGLPWVTAATQELFVPQMTNMELIGGVSFQKGCYPGQEVVARTQYLGKVKRRMYRARLDDATLPAEGTSLYSPDLPDQSCGNVINAAQASGGGVDLLVVVHQACFEGGQVHLGALDGPKLTFDTLPYAVT